MPIALADFGRERLLQWALVMSVAVVGAHGQQGSPRHHFEMAPCEIQGITGEKNCGYYEVYEDREKGTGRKIRIKVFVLRATGRDRAADPVLYLPGGPGAAATAAAPSIASAYSRIREKRDLVFIDLRGTGESHPLNCGLYDPANRQSYFGPTFPANDILRCRHELELDANLLFYTTQLAVDDLDDVRAALGYERWNLFGTSYGTRAALVYLKRHGEHVRSVMLHGVSPTDELVPLNFAANSERALQGVMRECAQDQDCRDAFPHLQSEEEAVFSRLLKGPVNVSLGAVPGVYQPNPAPTSNKGDEISLSYDRAAEAIRFMLYGNASRVPLMLHKAAEGNYIPIVLAVLSYRRAVLPNVSVGLYLSVTCSEDVQFVDAGQASRMAANTFLKDSSVRQLKQTCTEWPRQSISADYTKPTESDVSALITSGEWDPVTPPSNGEAVARYLPNSVHVIVPHGGHDFGDLLGVDCILRVQEDFVERGTAKNLNLSCVADIRRQGFTLH